MTPDDAEQIANLLNTQNQLTVPYTVAKVLEHQDWYVVRQGTNGQVLGAVEVKKVQWYQCEILHLSVHSDAKRQGIGAGLLQEAEAKARGLGCRVAQCTIRVGNPESESLFKKHGYLAAATFWNNQSGNEVAVYQKVLVSEKEGGA